MAEIKPTVKEIYFYSDGLRLAGSLHLPARKHPPVVIGCHGLYSSRRSPKQIALADGCCKLGIAYLRFDHRGCGDSQGDFERDTSLEARCRDLAAAAAFIRERADMGQCIGLFGSSMGGAVCLNAAGELDIRTLVTFAAPVCSDLGEKNRPPEGLRREPSAIFLDSAKRQFDITPRLAGIANILIVHGQADDVVPVAHAREIYRRAGEPKKLVIQPGGDHPMSDASHQQAFMEAALQWFQSALL